MCARPEVALRLTCLVSNGSTDPEIGDLWLSTSKIALKADHMQTAYTAILQARQMQTDYTFVQSAKLYKASGHIHRALQELDQGLARFGVLDGPTQGATYDAATSRRLSKVRFMCCLSCDMTDTSSYDRRR